jgi:hypothetical protein
MAVAGEEGKDVEQYFRAQNELFGLDLYTSQPKEDGFGPSEHPPAAGTQKASFAIERIPGV